MQCSITLERDHNNGNKMKTLNNYKNPYKKESNLDKPVDHLHLGLQDIEDQKVASQVGMPTCSVEHSEAVRRYCAAFPALKKGDESPLLYYLPPPAWCRKSAPEDQVKMQSEISAAKDWNIRYKKSLSSKERRNSYHGHKRNNKKRSNSYSRSFEDKESLPEWVTHEGVWDIETQDPVKEFIRALALDEGYGTCENTVTDEIKEITQVNIRMNADMVPDWDDGLDLDTDWVITQEDLDCERIRSPLEEELYAKFEAKFDRSIEALWLKDQNTPDDEYQDLPIDFQDLLSSPSDHLFADPSTEKCSLISLTESIWSNASDSLPPIGRTSTSRIVDGLRESFKPLNLMDEVSPPVFQSLDFDNDEILDVVPTVTKSMHSFTAINHSRDRSGFAEVPPRPKRRGPLFREAPKEERSESKLTPPREDLLTSARTHFRPIRRESEEAAPRYADGDSFDIRGELDVIEYKRSESGGVYFENSLYLDYRVDNVRSELKSGFKLRFPIRQLDAGVQTDLSWGECEECGRSAKKMRPNAIESIWSVAGGCETCTAPPVRPPTSVPPPDELSREWEELLSDISAAHAQYANGESTDLVEETLVSADRKRRHSAALRCAEAISGVCSHPHARFLHCCTLALDRPLTR